LKNDEEALLKLAETYNIDFFTYPAEELKIYEHKFTQSDFVRKITGVGNVCESAAYISSKKGDIIVNKRAFDKITVAVAKENWRVVFEDTDDRVKS
jgi:cobalt-precorrin 5A hydrolase